MDRNEALALLEEQHVFPGSFGLRVIVARGTGPEVIEAVRAALGSGDSLHDVRERPSRAGNWVSLRLEVRVERAETVLDLYALLDGIDGVRMTM